MSLELVIPSNHLILCCPLLLLPSIFPASGSFPVSWLFASGGQSFGASAWVLPMNIQGWFPLGLTGLISLQSQGLSRVFSSTIVQKHQFCSSQLSLWSNSHLTSWWLVKVWVETLWAGLFKGRLPAYRVLKFEWMDWHFDFWVKPTFATVVLMSTYDINSFMSPFPF